MRTARQTSAGDSDLGYLCHAAISGARWRNEAPLFGILRLSRKRSYAQPWHKIFVNTTAITHIAIVTDDALLNEIRLLFMLYTSKKLLLLYLSF